MIEVARISKRYGKRVILEDISFQVKSGERVAIVGKNGSGKTTLLQIMAGVTRADVGEIRYFGENAAKSSTFRKYCGYVPQDNPLLEELSVKDNLRLWSGANDMWKTVVAQFHLTDIMGQKVEKLSGGMKRRVSIACALLQNPPILILDEPTTALDIYYKDSILQWMDDYNKKNGIILMTTHEEKEILSADRCLVMHEGHMLEFSKDEISMQQIRNFIKTE